MRYRTQVFLSTKHSEFWRLFTNVSYQTTLNLWEQGFGLPSLYSKSMHEKHQTCYWDTAHTQKYLHKWHPSLFLIPRTHCAWKSTTTGVSLLTTRSWKSGPSWMLKVVVQTLVVYIDRTWLGVTVRSPGLHCGVCRAPEARGAHRPWGGFLEMIEARNLLRRSRWAICDGKGQEELQQTGSQHTRKKRYLGTGGLEMQCWKRSSRK